MVDQLADQLVRTFNNPERRTYYCRLGWKLSEAVIWRNVEAAKRGREPAKLFTWLCEQELAAL